MKTENRFLLFPVKAGEGVLILDTLTGNIQYPMCWEDLSAYHHYLVNKGHFDEAQMLLADSMAGNKPITRMRHVA